MISPRSNGAVPIPLHISIVRSKFTKKCLPRVESLIAFKRAGAERVLTYFAPRAAETCAKPERRRKRGEADLDLVPRERSRNDIPKLRSRRAPSLVSAELYYLCADERAKVECRRATVLA
jgi:hypothetical protein